MNSLLERDCADVFALIKFRVEDKGEEIANTLTEMLNTLKAMAT